MNLLLDTHIFLWYISGDQKLSNKTKDTISDPANQVYLSVVSVWETIVKYRLGKLPLPQAQETYLPEQRARHQISSLSLDEESVRQLGQLPPLHRDPFDRMLICQAIEHKLVLVTEDPAIRAYSVSLL